MQIIYRVWKKSWIELGSARTKFYEASFLPSELAGPGRTTLNINKILEQEKKQERLGQILNFCSKADLVVKI